MGRRARGLVLRPAQQGPAVEGSVLVCGPRLTKRLQARPGACAGRTRVWLSCAHAAAQHLWHLCSDCHADSWCQHTLSQHHGRGWHWQCLAAQNALRVCWLLGAEMTSVIGADAVSATAAATAAAAAAAAGMTSVAGAAYQAPLPHGV
jgi:hypothetical protein